MDASGEKLSTWKRYGKWRVDHPILQAVIIGSVMTIAALVIFAPWNSPSGEPTTIQTIAVVFFFWGFPWYFFIRPIGTAKRHAMMYLVVMVACIVWVLVGIPPLKSVGIGVAVILFCYFESISGPYKTRTPKSAAPV